MKFSIKIGERYGGCYHRKCSPKAYEIIDNYLSSIKDKNFSFEEHESGPELFIQEGANIATIIAGIATVVGIILKARKEGIKKGDRETSPREIIFRQYNNNGVIEKETIIKTDSNDLIDKTLLKNILLETTNSNGRHKRSAHTKRQNGKE